MRGLDGNYINTQGDASARMQVAYQVEQNRQQIQAQLETLNTIRKLKEQVNETEKQDPSSGLDAVRDEQSAPKHDLEKRKKNNNEKHVGKQTDTEVVVLSFNNQPHIDIKV
jgi:hypothetical protein